MKLIDLIPVNRVNENEGSDWLDYVRKFSEVYDSNVLFDLLGEKDGVKMYTANLTSFGDLGILVSKAQIVAKCSKKECIFGVVYILNDLEIREATLCKIKRKEKDGHTTLEVTKFDKDSKAFKGDDTKFKSIVK